MWSDIKSQLDKVSRSFALCIPLLEKGLKEPVGIAYLLLRALDSIEDCQLSTEDKNTLFLSLNTLVTKQSTDSKDFVALFEEQKWPGIKLSEVEFMTEGGFSRTINYFWCLEPSFRSIIQSCLSEMSLGMRKYSSENHKVFLSLVPGKKVLRSLESYNDYCYYVAGTVGILLTELSQIFYSSKKNMSQSVKSSALAFGRVLQKVNIIKDCREDYERGCCFLPKPFVTKASSRVEKINFNLILKDLEEDFTSASHYIFSLPESYKKFKKFCLLALVPAYKTLLYISENQHLFSQYGKAIKMPKVQMLKCFTEVMAGTIKKDSLDKLHEKLFIKNPLLASTL